MTHTFQSDFLNESKRRGFIHQCTDLEGLDKALKEGTVVSYTGFDPTGPSLHVGHLMPIMWMRLLQRFGHKPIVIVGGATSLIPDPTGKDHQRPLLTPEDIQENINALTPVFKRCLRFDDSNTGAMMLNNYDWLRSKNYIDFLRDYGSYFSVNRMLTFESVKMRLDREEPLSFIEFNYMILQAYDFLHLNRTQKCTLQMAGSDQWGNIINGIDLARRCDGTTLFGLTAPLLTTASGAKMGKTAGGAVWLNEDQLSHFDFWQFWRNTNDADVGRFLRIFTDLSLDEIEKLEKREGQELNEVKKILANEVTALIRGENVLDDIHVKAKELFENGKARQDLSLLPCTLLNKDDFPIAFDDLCVRQGLVASKGEIRRLVEGGGVRINDQVMDDVKCLIDACSFVLDGRLKISIGKKKHFLFSSK